MDNKTDYKQLLMNTVNFEAGYGASNNWIGFFERKVNFSNKVVVKAIDIFTDYFSKYLNNLIIATSLYKDADNIKFKKAKILNMEKEMYEINCIKIINENSYFSKDQDIFDKQYNKLVLDFTIKQSNENILRKISYLMMENSNICDVQGHCFFILEEHGLIIYPHEDTGYGFIGIKDKNNEMAINFLNKVFKENEFGGRIS
jgi:hypothetical protein